MLKWMPGFRFEEDPPVVPIWVALYDLPIEFMHLEVIYSMATALGQPLKVDTQTLNMTRPSVARFCPEVDLTKVLPKSVKVGRKGRKHEQFFTFERIPSYCSKCCKIGHKDIDCRVGKPMERMNNADKTEVPVNKGIKIKSAKPKWTLKGGDSNNALKAQIVSLNPLVVKGVEKAAKMATETLKETILVDLQPSPDRTEVVCIDAPVLVPSGNQFSILQAAEDDEAEEEMVNVHSAINSDVHTQNQEGQDNIGAILVDGNSDLANNRAFLEVELRNLSPVPQQDSIRFNDDTFENEIPDTDVFHDERAFWSDGEIHDDHIVENEQGERTVTKKWWRKSKEERAKQSEGVELRRSLSLQSLDEYSGSSVQDYGAIEEFNECIDDSELLDLPPIGDEYTWGGTRHTGWAEAWVKELEIRHDQTGDIADRINLSEANAFYLQKLKEHEDFWKQRMRLKWLKEGDIISAFFHATLAEKNVKLGIQKIQSVDGRTLTELRDIEAEAVSFFHTLLTEELAPTSQAEKQEKFLHLLHDELDLLDKEMLNAAVTMEELRAAVFNLGEDSSPRVDGFGGTFYRAFWHVIAEDLLCACAEFMSGVPIPKDSGYGFVIRCFGENFLYGEHGYVGACDSFGAEVYGLLFGVRKCAHLNLEHADVQTDNKARPTTTAAVGGQPAAAVTGGGELVSALVWCGWKDPVMQCGAACESTATVVSTAAQSLVRIDAAVMWL
ncbi:OLC1v1005137C1 [Oldenlandia corymbosa var. corymbosa]|uniref:OLC1v1005137C1 n=1 Tax=Oldenlandia corymbosa var. corymbosa TaxID=529605 RepID=A0AAV1DDY5_OLDCO|nr:OLC1v1005137C1 [Oldenlandia corymbosa var. corymbosa]